MNFLRIRAGYPPAGQKWYEKVMSYGFASCYIYPKLPNMTDNIVQFLNLYGVLGWK